MKKVLVAVMVLGSVVSYADVTQVMNGRGLDGKPCSAKIVRNGNEIKSIQLQGAAKEFEIIGESGVGYGPNTRISSRGADKIFNIFENSNGDSYRYFERSEGWISAAEKFVLDTNNIPRRAQDDLKGIKMVFTLQLGYQGGKLKSVNAESKAKALGFVKLASSAFTCE